MKIAHLFQSSGIQFSEPGAVQLHIYHTIRGLLQCGHHVDLLALQTNRRILFSSGVHAFENERLAGDQYGKLGTSDTQIFKKYESAVRRLQILCQSPYLALFDSFRMYDGCYQNLKGYDLYHERYNLLAIGGAMASRRLGIPLVLEVNADLIAQRKFKGEAETGIRLHFARWATKFCFASATKVVCVSAELKEHLREAWQVEASKLVALPCAADVEAFGQTYDTASIRRELGLTTEPVVMWVGGFYRWHDLDLLLQSFAKVLQELPTARLVLVGNGETRTQVEEWICTNALQHAVLLTGAIPHARVPEMLGLADVTVVPSAPVPAHRGGTGTPLKLFEYMAAGKAIVATALHHAATVIQDQDTGLLVAPGDGDGFANAISGLLKKPEERRRLGYNARQYAVEQHSWEQYARQLERIYLEVLRP